jgi:hypothetical protein
VEVPWQRINEAIRGALGKVTLAEMAHPPAARAGVVHLRGYDDSPRPSC